MIPPLFNWRGYTAAEPLENLNPVPRYLLSMAIAALVSIVFLFIVFQVLQVATLQHGWLFWVECGVLALLYMPMVVLLRKSNSLVLMAMLMIPAVALDLYIQAHFRDVGLPALWVYNPDGLLGWMPPWLQILVVWSIDAFVAGPVALWCSRLAARALAGEGEPPLLFSDHYEQLFPRAWTEEAVVRPKRDFAFYGLRILGLVYFVYLILLLLGALGTSPWPTQLAELLKQSYENPPLTINTFIKLALMVTLSFVGAYNEKLRWHCGLALLVGHLMSTVISLLFYWLDPPGTPYRDFLLTSAIVDAALVIFFAYLLIRYRDQAKAFTRDKEFPAFYSLPHRMTTIFFYVFGTVLALIVPGILGLRLLLDGSQGWGAVYGFPDPQVANTITKYTTLSLLAFMLAPREALREHLLGAITTAYSISVIVSALWLLVGDMISDVVINTRLGTQVTVDWYFMLNVIMDGIVLILITAIRRVFYNVEYTVSALSPYSAQNVMALHDALLASTSDSRETVLKQIDAYVTGIQGRKRGLLNFPFWLVESVFNLVYGLRASFSDMSAEERRYFLRKYILRPPQERARSFIPPLAELSYRIGTSVHAFINLAHYSSLYGWQEIGFVPPDARDRLQGLYPTARPPFQAVSPLPDNPEHPANHEPELPPPPQPFIAPRVVTRTHALELPTEVDYLIVGSGAGGAVMAYRLACQVADPSKVLVVERGPHFSPRQDFNDNEMEMIRKLYKEGGLQQTKRFDLNVLQGECLGGTTVMNNGICAKMPPAIRAAWQNQYGIDLSDLDDEYERIAEDIDIAPLPETAINERVEQRFWAAVENYNRAVGERDSLHMEVLQANHRNLVGSGAWNLGNRHMRKRSMLETYLPWAQAREVMLAPETSAVRCHFEHDRRVNAVSVRTLIGQQRRIGVRKGVIVAGGVIASSHFLMRSGLEKNVGQGVSCNFALPVSVAFEEALNAFDGVQIALAAEAPQSRAIFETFFSPPGLFAISMPFYFHRHQDIMQQYPHVINFGALVGSQPNGVIGRQADLLNGRPLSWQLGPTDQEHIKFALSTLVALAEKGGGQQAVMPMEPGLSIPLTPENVAHFQNSLKDFPLQMSHLRLATAHPQGGNRMIGRSGEAVEQRVIDESFRVAEIDNLFIADASLFPAGITVNPQWTVMAMSSKASTSVLELME